MLFAVGLGLAAWLPGLSGAADQGKITVEKVEYKGWKHNLRLSNGDVELIVTLDVGPRIISYRLPDGKNVFKVFSEGTGKSGEEGWQPRGGHRLWVGPEDLTRTYAADNGQVAWSKNQDGSRVTLTPGPETEFGIQKEIDIELAAKGSRVKVIHRIKNIGEKSTRLAPWALSMMAAGGVEIIPLPSKKPHPGPPKNATSAKDFAPNQVMVLWPFFDFKDPRWTFGSKYITLRHDSKRGPTKIGLAHQVGWVGYVNHGTLFIKRFGHEERKRYPDHGSNFETFSNEDMQEIETLGPLVNLAAGKSVEHTEDWELVGDVGDVTDEASIDKHVLPKVKGKEE
ncbi:MAG TPA: hypothetical protein VG013_10815 [Gemmataceae bacterium]|nr:hypothetical protein [Gemmataceae bacterium]